jgi:type I site-specific restriction-modification system R (restriction) subunit
MPRSEVRYDLPSDASTLLVCSRRIDHGNGFVWNTGSGKTLTSFKASTLLKENDSIYKCVFVVDRKDLDRQTREEFNRFQEGSVEVNTNTASLVCYPKTTPTK